MENAFSILLVSNDLDYSFKLRSLLRDVLPRAHLRFARSDREATLYLRGVGIYGNRFCYPFPDLLLLDGEECVDESQGFIEWIRQRQSFSMLPLVVLGDTTSEEGSGGSYGAGANCFLVKREELESVREVISSIKELKQAWVASGQVAEPIS